MRRTGFSGRKAGILFLAFALIAGFAFSQGNVQEEVHKYVVVMKDANVRTMPSTKGTIITTVRSGEKLALVEDLGTWVKVKLPQGKIGYIWAKLVRIEVEKIVKPTVPKPAATPNPQVQKPAPKTYLKEKGSFPRFSVGIGMNFNMVNPSDFNAIAVGVNEFFNSYITPQWESAGYSTEIDHPLDELKRLFGGEIEGKIFFTENIALGLGFSMLSGSTNSTSRITGTSGGSTRFVFYDLSNKVTILTPYLGIHFVIPADMLNVELFGNLGYFMGSFGIDLNVENESSRFRYHVSDMKKNTLGFMGGAKLNFNLSPKMGVFISGKYTLAKFKDLTGTVREELSGTTVKGTAYYYEEDLFGIVQVPFMWVFETKPSGAPYRNVRKAEFDFSGFTLSAGFYFNF